MCSDDNQQGREESHGHPPAHQLHPSSFHV